MTTSQQLLRQPPKPQRPWISKTTMQLADQKHKLWRAWQANATSAAKASYKAANRATKQSASTDFERHWKAQLSSVQHSMRKGDIHSAYKCLNHLSKPKTKAGRSLLDRQSGRVLQSAEKRSAEWVSYCTQLLPGSTPIATEVLAQLPPPHPLLQVPPTPKPHWMRSSQPSSVSRTIRHQGSATSCQRC